MIHSKKFKLDSSFTDLARKAESWEIDMPTPAVEKSSKKEPKNKTHYTYPSVYMRDVPVPDASVGEEIMVRAKVRISEKTERETEAGESCTMDLEIIGIEWPKGMSLEEPDSTGDTEDAIERGLDEVMEDED
jgi:hypothetical protein